MKFSLCPINRGGLTKPQITRISLCVMKSQTLDIIKNDDNHLNGIPVLKSLIIEAGNLEKRLGRADEHRPHCLRQVVWDLEIHCSPRSEDAPEGHEPRCKRHHLQRSFSG